MSDLARTPLYERHAALGARLVPFAGWEMPVQYAGVIQEHRAVREAAGLFDVSHMGQLELRGSGAAASADRLLTCRVDTLQRGQARYGLLLNEDGGCVDDVMLHRDDSDHYGICVNASNRSKALDWISAHLGPDTELVDRSEETALLALQGPRARKILEDLLGADAGASIPRRFRLTETTLEGHAVRISGTGYTGGPGFELAMDAAVAGPLFDALLEAGREEGLEPAGLGARDTLRIEAALPLYGHELDDDTTPLEADLERFVKLERGSFLGAEALTRDAARKRRLIGFEVEGRGIARADYEIVREGQPVGRVTSGTHSPTLGKSIGLGYVPRGEISGGLAVRIRQREVPIREVDRPFWKPA